MLSRFYRSVPDPLLEELMWFRVAHPYRTALVRGTEWRYVSGGEGEPILLLPGASCVAEVSWRTIQGLEKGFRVLSPDYPALGSNADLAAGIAGLLDREGLNKVHVMGGSEGGLAAEHFLRQHPDRVTSLILSHAPVLRREAGMRLARLLVPLRRLPDTMVHWFYRARLRALVPRGHGPAVGLLWAQYRDVLATRVTKAQIISYLERTAELAVTQELGPVNTGEWAGRVLIILSEDDPSTPPSAQKQLLARYPTAEVRRFEGTGHVTSTQEPARFVAAVEEFLRPPG